jgi:hypothetical protein
VIGPQSGNTHRQARCTAHAVQPDRMHFRLKRSQDFARCERGGLHGSFRRAIPQAAPTGNDRTRRQSSG